MLYIHPVFQSFAILLTAYVLNLGVHRFRAIHLKHRTRFNWKRHVVLGKAALVVLTIGAFSGAVVVKLVWGTLFATGIHARVGLVLVALVLFGFGSGYYLDKVKKKRTALPLVHGLNNCLILALCLFQIVTGLGILKGFA